MSDFRESRYWDKQLEDQLPDCRVSPTNREHKRVRYGRLDMDVVFCSTCFRETGLVPPWTPHVFFICDDCFFKMNNIAPSGTIQIPEEKIHGKVL